VIVICDKAIFVFSKINKVFAIEGREFIRSDAGIPPNGLIEFKATKPSIIIGTGGVNDEIYNYIKSPWSRNRPFDAVKSAPGFNIDYFIEVSITIIVNLGLNPLT